MPCDRAFGGGAIEPHRTVEETFAVEPAEQEIGVGHDRIGRALAVGGGAGIGARAFRSDMDAADRIDPGDRAAARTDLDDVDDGKLHRLAADGMRR